MREKMPVVAGWVDVMRAAFGTDCINSAIRRGMKGEPTFHAVEGGHEIGTMATAPKHVVCCTDMVLVREDHQAKAGRGRK